MLNTTQIRLHAGAYRWFLIAVCALGVFAACAPAQRVQPAAATSIDGVYNGSYSGDQGLIKFKLSVTQQANGILAGSYTIYLPDGSDTKPYTCDVKGRYIAPNRMFNLIRGKWEAQPPAGIDMLGMNGQFEPAGADGAGQLSGRLRGRPGPQFQAIRDADESAKYAAANPAKDPAAAAPAAPAPDVAPPMRQPVAARPAVTRAPVAPAPPTVTGPAAINGVYTGEFKHVNDVMKLKLSIKAIDDGSLTALFTFDPPANEGGSSTTYKLTGKYVAKSHAYGLASSPFEFTAIEPVGGGAQEALAASQASAVHIGITGPGTIYGSMTGTRPGSGEFHVGWISGTMDRVQSADLDKTMLAQGSGVSTVVPVAPVVHPSFEGVYNGTYAGAEVPTTKFKLRLWLQRENKTAAGRVVSTEIAGLLTVFATDSSGTMPYTAEVKGTYGGANGTIQLIRGRWDPPPSGVFLTTGLNGKLDLGGGGNSAPRISGYFDQPSNPKFEATRDAAESASMDLDRLRKHIYPGTVGVFNGTYTRENEPPTKFKLTVHHNGQTASIVGLATIYLPAGSGTKAYSYDLQGLAIDHGHFELRVHDWVTPPPANFKNFKAMGFNGKVVLNEALTTAKMSSTPPASSMAEFYLPQFEATWEPTESADINGVLAAQTDVGSADQVAALKARDEMLKTALPKQLASKNLVRKSRAYWEGYQTDMIREVFDGGFGAGIDENTEFEEVFVTYVEMFSAKFPDALPANHVRVTNTVRTNRKFANGILISEENHDYTVDMDPRFVENYNQFWGSLNSKGAEIRGVIAAVQPGGAQRVLQGLSALAFGMQKFFADHGAKSAATRQLSENLLRGAKGEPSLQQADGKIDGAEAESDKNLPPGRYARFVDGANAFFRERARANPIKFGSSSSHDTALCQRLAELYDSKMTREEEYYYANDFGARFLPIMGQRASCPDPAWPQLHPAVEQAIGEVK